MAKHIVVADNDEYEYEYEDEDVIRNPQDSSEIWIAPYRVVKIDE